MADATQVSLRAVFDGQGFIVELGKMVGVRQGG